MLQLNLRSITQKTVILFLSLACILSSTGYPSSSRRFHSKKNFIKTSIRKSKNQQNSPFVRTSQRTASSLKRTNLWAVDGTDLNRANCLRRDPFTEEEMISWLNFHAYQKSKPVVVAQDRVNGIEFINESPALIQLFKDLVNRSGFEPEQYTKNFLSFSSRCTRVLCAAEDIFGKKVGIQLLYMLGRFGVNGSHYAQNHAQPWYTDELDEILLAFAAYPDSLHQQYYNIPFVHYERDIQIGDRKLGNQLGDAGGLFSSWNILSSDERFITVAHEKAHHFAKFPRAQFSTADTLSRPKDFDNNPEWYRLSGWSSEDQNTIIFDLGPFHLAYPSWVPSIYGRTNPREDFAESILKYRFNPNEFLSLLGENGRAKYDYIRDIIFKGIEFRSENDCINSFKPFEPTPQPVPQPSESPEQPIPTPTPTNPEPETPSSPPMEAVPAPQISPTPEPSPQPTTTTEEPSERLPITLTPSLTGPLPMPPSHPNQPTEPTPSEPSTPTPKPTPEKPTVNEQVEVIINTVETAVHEAIQEFKEYLKQP